MKSALSFKKGMLGKRIVGGGERETSKNADKVNASIPIDRTISSQ
jgi:hypothetical protein